MLTTIPLYGTPHPIFVLRDFSELPNGYDLGWAMCGIFAAIRGDVRTKTQKRHIASISCLVAFKRPLWH